jgi:hypothetical protein
VSIGPKIYFVTNLLNRMVNFSRILAYVGLGGRPCEKFVKMIGNDLTITGPSIGISEVKVDIGTFSNKNVEFFKVNHVLTSMDASQYLLCRTIENLPKFDPLRMDCERIRIQTILGFTQLQSLLDLKDDERFKDEIEDWINYMNDLVKVQISSLSPPARSVEPGRQVRGAKPKSLFSPEIKSELKRIAEYQGIDDDEFELVLRNSNFG